MNTSFQLFQVQQIDSEIDQATKRIEEIELMISGNKKIANAEKTLDRVQQIFIKRTNEFNQINDEIEKKRIKKNQSQSTLYSGKVHNPKELEDLQTEIQSLENIINSLEEKSMEALIALDNAEKDFEAGKKNLTNIRSEFATELSLLNAEKEKLQQEIKQLKKKRTPIFKLISDQYKLQYDALRKQKKGIAVTILAEGSCGACGANLTASQQQSARSSKSVFVCGNCRRIVYGGH